ncbi:ECF RNA polymerase sigma factor SigE [Polystyrenella longa]|uniref:ECF RNA polymerase sigma factor SigE n=1 Tax=Polystyrenella longa TaxID=2528007 RepID=A0A518CTG8_9PLAN|nr:sigma-70 family RNA polymerase sigma factor [Polystyrenella longa]QDU82516.1 ECF RNA polymerase sigma factor SigE [Polystyrenella longa]
MNHESVLILNELDDRQLIRLFHRNKNESAFTLLVQRHGAMVLRVCRKNSATEQDAEDAFQAVFMVLASNANKVNWKGCLANWLYGVAFRVSLKAKTTMQKRPREIDFKNDVADEETWQADWSNEMERILYEEIHRLPTKLQEPILLCSLEGHTREQAAQTLGVKESTLKGRLERARELLKTRMLKREVVLPSFILTGGLISQVSEAGFSSYLTFSPSAVATNLTLETIVSKKLGAASVKLAQGELANMLLITQLRAVVAIVLFLVMGSLLVPHKSIGNDTTDKVANSKHPVDDIEKKLVGKWQIISVTDGGKIRTLDSENAFIFSENTLKLISNGKPKTNPIKINVSEKPMWLDLKLPDGQVLKGIFEVTDKEFKFCLNESPGPRPTKFESVSGSSPNDLLMIAERNAESEYGGGWSVPWGLPTFKSWEPAQSARFVPYKRLSLRRWGRRDRSSEHSDSTFSLRRIRFQDASLPCGSMTKSLPSQ